MEFHTCCSAVKKEQTTDIHSNMDAYLKCLILTERSQTKRLFSLILLVVSGLQHTRLPCPSPPPEACSNSCPSNRRYHPTISSSVVPFFSCLQSFPASGSFLSQLFTSGGKVLEFQLQHQSFQIIFRADFL